MYDAWAGCAANHHGSAREISFRDRGEDTVLFMPHMHKLDLAVSPQGVDHGI